MKLFGSIKELVSAVFRKNSQEITLRPNQSVTYTDARDVQLPPENTDSVLMSATSQATMTNKSLDAEGTGNSITNLKDSNIKSGAAINRTKLASGTASHVIINDPSGVLSSEAHLDKTRGGTGISSSATFPSSGTVAVLTDITASNLTGVVSASKGGTGVSNNDAATLTRSGNHALTVTTTAPTNVTLPTSGTVATLTGAEVFTNKDYDGGTASNTSRTTLPKASKTILDGLTRKQGTLLYGEDTNKVYADDGSTLKEIGSGSSGINYLNGQFNADSLGTVELNVGDTLASSTRSNPTQWGNSAASALITQSTNSTLRGTTNYLVAYTANAQFVESPLFTIDGSDLASPLTVSFDVSGVTTADDVQVYVARYNSSNVLQERIVVAGTASATSPNSAQVPTATTNFRGFFIPSATATDKYAIRWRRNANNTSLRLDSFIVGPQSLAQGAIVTGFQSWTPTISNFGTATNINFRYMRSGSNLIAKASFTSGTPVSSIASITLPSGLTAVRAGNIGMYFRNITTGNNGGVILSTAGSNAINFSTCVLFNAATAVNAMTPANGNSILDVNDTMFLEFSVEIAEWSSGTTTLADRAVEEYAFSTSAITAAGSTQSDDGLYGYGPSGTQFNAIASTTINSRTRLRVRFQTPIQPTDSLALEVFISSLATWSSVSNSSLDFCPLTFQNTSAYGMTIETISGSATDVYVSFGNCGRLANASTYANNNGSSWSGVAGSSSFKWRVRKVSGGAAVGFPIAPANITLLNTTDNYSGNTRLGLMQYIGGNAYNNGITLTVTPSVSPTASFYKFIPYQMADGSWRMRFNIGVVYSASQSSGSLTVTGITFKSNGTIAYQSASVCNASAPSATQAICDNSANTIRFFGASGANNWAIAGDVELDAKPTWAY